MNYGLSSLSTKQAPFWLMGIILIGCFWAIVKTYEVTVTSQPDQSISRGIEYFLADNDNLPITELLGLPPEVWRSYQEEKLLLEQPEQTYWIKFQLPQLDRLNNWLLEIDNANLDLLDVWYLQDGQLLSEFKTGDQLPFRSRSLRHERFLFPVPNVENGGGIEVFLRTSNLNTMSLPINLWQEQTFLLYNGEHGLALGLFFGFMLAMALSNFFFFINSGSLNFLLYTAYAVSVALLLFSLHGLGFKYMWPENTWLQNHSIGVFANASLLFALLFIRQLLDLKTTSKLVDGSLKILAIMFALFIVVSLFFNTHFFNQAFLGLILLVVGYIFLAGLWLWRQGLKVSGVYTLAWITLLISALFAALDGLQIYETILSTRYLLMLGATIETVLLALLLAMNYSNQSRDLLATRELALAREKEATAAKEQTIEVQKRANEELEYNVQERTLELEITLRELAEKNQELEEKNTLDALTGIRNRRHFDKRYLAELRKSRREQTELAVAMVDIDHFKKVNDTHGHLVGDDCIKHVAQVLDGFLKRPSDEVCRYGGEEFAVLMPSTEQAGAQQVMEGIRESIAAQPVVTSTVEVPLTVSIGICSAIAATDLEDNTILDNADQALYKAKQNGRNQVQYQNCFESSAVSQLETQESEKGVTP